MKRKIIGATVGSPLPKPNLMQTDPKKGDYVKGKEEFLKQVPGGGDADLTGYATEEWVQEGYQPKGEYLYKEDYIDWFGTGTSIPSNADLNGYKTNGKFYANSESVAKTLSNRPDGMDTNFCMFVFDRTNGVKSQLMVTLAGKMYIRSTSSTAWRSWVAYTTSDEIADLTETVKAELQAELEQYVGVYTLADGETIADAPEWAEIVVDPHTDPDTVEMVAVLDDGTSVTYKLFCEVV